MVDDDDDDDDDGDDDDDDDENDDERRFLDIECTCNKFKNDDLSKRPCEGKIA